METNTKSLPTWENFSPAYPFMGEIKYYMAAFLVAHLAAFITTGASGPVPSVVVVVGLFLGAATVYLFLREFTWGRQPVDSKTLERVKAYIDQCERYQLAPPPLPTVDPVRNRDILRWGDQALAAERQRKLSD